MDGFLQRKPESFTEFLVKAVDFRSSIALSPRRVDGIAHAFSYLLGARGSRTPQAPTLLRAHFLP
jgi:hypothetical protein